MAEKKKSKNALSVESIQNAMKGNSYLNGFFNGTVNGEEEELPDFGISAKKVNAKPEQTVEEENSGKTAKTTGIKTENADVNSEKAVTKEKTIKTASKTAEKTSSKSIKAEEKTASKTVKTETASKAPKAPERTETQVTSEPAVKEKTTVTETEEKRKRGRPVTAQKDRVHINAFLEKEAYEYLTKGLGFKDTLNQRLNDVIYEWYELKNEK